MSIVPIIAIFRAIAIVSTHRYECRNRTSALGRHPMSSLVVIAIIPLLLVVLRFKDFILQDFSRRHPAPSSSESTAPLFWTLATPPLAWVVHGVSNISLEKVVKSFLSSLLRLVNEG